jgi:hypothetical protein
MNWNAVNNRLSDIIVRNGRMDELLAELGCDLYQLSVWGGTYRGPCPFHGGDGDNFVLRTDGHSIPV